MQRDELGARPHRRRYERIGRGVGAVVQQGGQVAVRVGAQDEPGAWIELTHNGFDGRGGTETHQPPNAGSHVLFLLGRRREHAQVDAAAGVDECGKAPHSSSIHPAFEDSRQFVEVLGPAAQPGSLQVAGDRLRHGLLGRRRETFLQHPQILAPGHLGAVAGLHRERHPQMRRQLVQVEGVDRHQNPGAAA